MGKVKELWAAEYWKLCEEFEMREITEKQFIDGMRSLGYSRDEIDDHIDALKGPAPPQSA